MTAALHALTLALALAALPFPAPRQAPVTDRLRSDAGTVLRLDAERFRLQTVTFQVMTAAGIVTFRLAPDVPVLDRTGAPLGADALQAGRPVRVWFVLEDGGAKAVEVGLE
ncbi:MAG: hypothetical protein QM767_07490 [Anaeromyxobacter sp.]